MRSATSSSGTGRAGVVSTKALKMEGVGLDVGKWVDTATGVGRGGLTTVVGIAACDAMSGPSSGTLLGSTAGYVSGGGATSRRREGSGELLHGAAGRLGVSGPCTRGPSENVVLFWPHDGASVGGDPWRSCMCDITGDHCCDGGCTCSCACPGLATIFGAGVCKGEIGDVARAACAVGQFRGGGGRRIVGVQGSGCRGGEADLVGETAAGLPGDFEPERDQPSVGEHGTGADGMTSSGTNILVVAAGRIGCEQHIWVGIGLIAGDRGAEATLFMAGQQHGLPKGSAPVFPHILHIAFMEGGLMQREAETSIQFPLVKQAALCLGCGLFTAEILFIGGVCGVPSTRRNGEVTSCVTSLDVFLALSVDRLAIALYAIP